MRLLLDTHIIVWAATGGGKLSAEERSVMADPANHLFASAVSLWELRLKWHSLHVSGERKGPVDPAVVLAFARRIGWELLPLDPAHAVAALAVPLLNRDPFDELLLVQSQQEGCRLLTRDAKLANHPLALVP